MKYLNAEDVLPDKLLKELQKYAGGALLYVPKEESEGKLWGEVSGQKKYYTKRNRMIVNKFRYGTSVEQLAKEYCLSKETVKKIVYSKENANKLVFGPNVFSAKEYNDNELLEEWIHTYLLFERKNKAFSDGLYEEERFFVGPLAMSLRLFERCCGPEENMKWRVDPVIFEQRVAAWQEKIRKNQFLPPLIVGYTKGAFELNCNNPLFEALQREKVRYFPVIIWGTEESDYRDFLNRYTEFVLK